MLATPRDHRGGRIDIGAYEFVNAGSFPTQMLPFLNGPSFVKTKIGRSVNVSLNTTNGASAYSITGQPAGLTISNSGVITGTVASSKSGAYVATVTGTNSYGASKLRIVFSVDP
jgi:hypothetical protein